jgi:hypothetical protein
VDAILVYLLVPLAGIVVAIYLAIVLVRRREKDG